MASEELALRFRLGGLQPENGNRWFPVLGSRQYFDWLLRPVFLLQVVKHPLQDSLVADSGDDPENIAAPPFVWRQLDGEAGGVAQAPIDLW